MGNPLFGIDIAGIIHESLSAGLLKGKLRQFTAGARISTALTDGQHPTSKVYNFRGILDDFTENEIDGQRILASDKKLLLIGNSLPRGVEPGAGDEAEIEGTIFKVESIHARDPAAAHYVLQVR